MVYCIISTFVNNDATAPVSAVASVITMAHLCTLHMCNTYLGVMQVMFSDALGHLLSQWCIYAYTHIWDPTLGG